MLLLMRVVVVSCSHDHASSTPEPTTCPLLLLLLAAQCQCIQQSQALPTPLQQLLPRSRPSTPLAPHIWPLAHIECTYRAGPHSQVTPGLCQPGTMTQQPRA
jgi:hypothetical protein